MAISITPVISKNTPALGLTVSWEGCQFVMIVTNKGLVSCGVVDKTVMEKFSAVIAIARGTPEKPLVTIDDLLNAKIADLTEKAKDYGIKIGMTGKEALERLSD